ncbi:ABC transporter permease [Bacillus luteolus]|uniref:ABC transporter permease n=1 Tax=Litchfieldia luteola TaxID=682179 RepID=A0ABR9QE34_9BACI|nr:ABC transporter permease [Cytobacillus luteolus]MBE4906760.1 ABC transporter permease [Cytobacillus luteolus]MBP1940589.1 ABC-2 type transport system permease protein [Cytobacillus luteolus]
MNKFWLIFFHTYLNKLKSKSFIITTIITAVIVLGLTNIQTIIDMFDKGDDDRIIAVIDETGELYPLYEQQFQVFSNKLAIEQFGGSVEEAKEKVSDGEYAGLLEISYDEEQLPQGVFSAMSITDSEAYSQLEQALQQLKVSLATSKLGLTAEQVNQLYVPVMFEKIALEEDAKSEEELSQARGLVYILLFVIYFAVIMYASMIAMEVATEKSSRVMEILISSVSPIKLMFGKILGIALLSITQFAFILTVGYLSLRLNPANSNEGIFSVFGLSNIPISTFIYAIVFFVLGYLLFATLAAFLGSLVSRIEDVQQMITPMTLVIVIAFMIAMFGLGKPEASFITVTSFIPFFAPMIMFLRVGMLNVPIWEVALSIGLLVTTIVLLAVFGARVYRGGVLMYGKSSSFKDIKKALQLTKNEK